MSKKVFNILMPLMIISLVVFLLVAFWATSESTVNNYTRSDGAKCVRVDYKIGHSNATCWRP